MSALVLRTAAVFFMLLDHIGYATGNAVLRIVGRLSLPIFAFLIANGFRHTRSVPKYALRLAVFAFLSEIPFDLYFHGRVTLLTWRNAVPQPQFDNIYFALLLGLLFLWLRALYQKYLPRIAWLCSIGTLLICAYGAAFISADYGVFGVLWVALFGVLDVQSKVQRIPLCFGVVLLSFWRIICKSIFAYLGMLTPIPVFSAFFPTGVISFMDHIQPFAALAMLLLLFYNGKSGMPRSRTVKTVLQYAFYAFYPLHILVFWLVF